jgi:hypothetical protein
VSGDRFPCEHCGGRQLFETPPCTEGHGTDCPERVCTRCGSALLLGGPPGYAPRDAAPAGADTTPSRLPAAGGLPRHAA